MSELIEAVNILSHNESEVIISTDDDDVDADAADDESYQDCNQDHHDNNQNPDYHDDDDTYNDHDDNNRASDSHENNKLILPEITNSSQSTTLQLHSGMLDLSCTSQPSLVFLSSSASSSPPSTPIPRRRLHSENYLINAGLIVDTGYEKSSTANNDRIYTINAVDNDDHDHRTDDNKIDDDDDDKEDEKR